MRCDKVLRRLKSESFWASDLKAFVCIVSIRGATVQEKKNFFAEKVKRPRKSAGVLAGTFIIDTGNHLIDNTHS